MRHLSDYLDFILENISQNKTRIYYSKELKSLLQKVANKSNIADLLLKAENSNQVEDIYTLIDITDKNDTISFTQVNRIKRKYPEDDIIRMPYVHNSDSTGKGSEFWREGRTDNKIGRWVKRFFTKVYKLSDITDSKIEEFVNLYKSSYDSKADDSKFEIVSGEDIRNWYLESNYESTKGQLGKSCMRYRSCQEYLDIYVKNPEVCQLIILRSNEDNDKIIGRALVWKLTNDSYYMDRIYTINDSDKLLFFDFFENWQMENSYKVSHQNLEVKLGNYTYSKYPYMDTFIVYNPKDKILSDNEDLWPGKGYIKIQDIDGGFQREDAIWSEWNSDYISREDAVWCENINSYIYTDDATYLNYKDEWVYQDDSIVWSEFHCEYFYKDDVVYSEIMDDYLYPENIQVIEVNISENDIDWLVKSRTDLYIKHENKYFLRKNYIKDPYTGEYHFIDEKVWGDLLYHKIREEIFPGDDSDHNKLCEKAKQKILDIYRSGKLKNKEVISSIESNEIYIKSLKNVYWGMNSSELLTSEEMIPSLLAAITFTGSSLPSSGHISLFLKEVEKLTGDVELNLKYNKMARMDARYIRTLYRLDKSFDYSSFGSEIEKLYLLFNLE